MVTERPHDSEPGLENLWTTKQAAEFLHISPKTVFVLRRKKGLPYIKLGGAVRFVPEEIRKYLDYSRRLSSHRLRQIPCKRPSAAWCAREHGVSREWASRLQRDFARHFDSFTNPRNLRGRALGVRPFED